MNVKSISAKAAAGIVALVVGFFLGRAGLKVPEQPSDLKLASVPAEPSATEVAATAEAEALRAELADTQDRLRSICAAHAGKKRWLQVCAHTEQQEEPK